MLEVKEVSRQLQDYSPSWWSCRKILMGTVDWTLVLAEYFLTENNKIMIICRAKLMYSKEENEPKVALAVP